MGKIVGFSVLKVALPLGVSLDASDPKHFLKNLIFT